MQPPIGLSNANSAYRRTKIRRLITWLPVGLWMAFIFYWSAQSTLPGLSQSLLDLLLKKGAHFAVFAVLALLIYRAARPGLTPVAALLAAAIIAIAYGALDEFHQAFVPGRNPALLDVLIDAAGAVLALTFIHRSPNRIAALLPARSNPSPPRGR